MGGVTQEQLLSKLPKNVLATVGEDEVVLTQPSAKKSKETGRALEQLVDNHPLSSSRSEYSKGSQKIGSPVSETFIKHSEFTKGGVKDALKQLGSLKEQGVEYIRKGNRLFVKCSAKTSEQVQKLLEPLAILNRGYDEAQIAERAAARAGDASLAPKIKKRLLTHTGSSAYVQSGISYRSDKSTIPLETYVADHLKSDAYMLKKHGFNGWDKPLAKIRVNIAHGYSENAAVRFFQKVFKFIH